MKLMTTKDLIRGVPERWKAQYCHGTEWGKTMTGDTREVYEQLKALDPETATHNHVTAIIGNPSWSRMSCNECDAYVDAVVEVGQPPDYESATAQLCAPCMHKAIALFGLAGNGPAEPR